MLLSLHSFIMWNFHKITGLESLYCLQNDVTQLPYHEKLLSFK